MLHRQGKLRKLQGDNNKKMALVCAGISYLVFTIILEFYYLLEVVILDMLTTFFYLVYSYEI